MYINAMGCYVPSTRIDNDHFLDINGLTADWILQRTGISTRSKCAAGENQHTMAIEAVESCLAEAPYPVTDVDLIIGAGYAVYDSVATTAHIVQQHWGISNAKALYLTSACSSFINALETAEAFFLAGKATKALIVCSEQNSYYANESDPKSGHLWGDGAVAWLVSKDRVSDNDWEVLSVVTQGLGHVSKGPAGVRLRPREDGITMPDGRDVFINACRYMVSGLKEALDQASAKIEDVKYIAPHQANMRIVAQVAHQLSLPMDRFINNIQELGNTGSASCAIVLTQRKEDVQKGDLVAMSVFGGGYSCGATVIRK